MFDMWWLVMVEVEEWRNKIPKYNTRPRQWLWVEYTDNNKESTFGIQ